MLKSESQFPTPQIALKLRHARRHEAAGEWSQADDCYGSAVSDDFTAVSRIAFASSLATRERYHESLCLLTEAMDLASISGDRQALGMIFHNLAGIYREIGDADLARRFQQRAILQVDDCGPVELMGLANDAWLSRRVELASCLAASCSDLEDESGDDEISLEAQATLATITGLEDDARAGIRMLIDVYRRHAKMGAYRLMGIDLLNLSVLFAQIGWYRAESAAVQNSISHFDRAAAPISAEKARQLFARLSRMQSLRQFDPTLN